MDVGFIGLGQMGQAIALNLVKAGHRVVVFNRTRAKAEALASQGAEVADSVADACRRPVLISMLADDAAVEGVFFGNGNGLVALGEGAVHISMSTISVALSDRLAEAHREAGQAFVAAPVFGRPEAAAAAKLFVVAAGAEATLARCRPLFDAIGQRTFVVGDKPSSANLVKLSGNFLLAAVIECLGEAFALTRKGGVDPHLYLEILTSTLFSAPAYKTYGTIIANQQYEPAGFKMSLGLKDIRLALAAADALATPMPVASLVHDHFLSGVAQGAGDLDWSALARVVAAKRRSLTNAGIARKTVRSAPGLSGPSSWGRFSLDSAVIRECWPERPTRPRVLAAIRGKRRWSRSGILQSSPPHAPRLRSRPWPTTKNRRRQPAYTPRLNDIMVVTQLGHFKLWYAGAVQNWPLANYELEQIRASIILARTLFPDSNKSDMDTMKPAADDLGKAIKAKDAAGFTSAYSKLTAACNACHEATGFGFIKIRVPRLSPIETSPFSDEAFPAK